MADPMPPKPERTRWHWLMRQLQEEPFAAVSISAGVEESFDALEAKIRAANRGLDFAVRVRVEPLRMLVWRAELGTEPPRTENQEAFFDPFFLRLWS